jgi:hypothetical protein
VRTSVVAASAATATMRRTIDVPRPMPIAPAATLPWTPTGRKPHEAVRNRRSTPSGDAGA